MSLLDSFSKKIATSVAPDTMEQADTKAKSTKKQPKTKRDTIASVMQYDEAYYNGMIRKGREYSVVYEIPNVTFRGISEDKQKSVMEHFVEILNSFDSYLKNTLMIANIRENGDIGREVKYPTDNYTDYAVELNGIFKQQFSTHNAVTTYRLLVIRGTFDNPMDADNQFSIITNNLDELFVQAWQVRGKMLSIGKRLHLTASILKKDYYNPYLIYDKETDDYTVDDDLLKKRKCNVDDIIFPQYLKFNIKDFAIDDRVARSYFLANIGNSISTDFLYSIYNIDAEMVIAVDLNGVESSEALKKLDTKYSHILAEVDDKDGFQTLEQISEQESILDMQDKILNHDEKSYNASIVLTLFAQDKKELEGLQQQVYSKARRHRCGFEPLFASQRYGFMSCCLMGFYAIEFKRFFNAHELGAFIPFDVPEYFDGDGIYYGLHKINHLPIFYDRNKNDNYNALVLGKSGCVDCKTEFFNGKEWKSIADYHDAEMVLQYDPRTDEAALVTPLSYIKKPCDKMYHFESTRGLDQTLSPEHRVLSYIYEDGKMVPKVMLAEELYEQQNAGKFHGRIKTDFSFDGKGMDISDEELMSALTDKQFSSSDWYNCNKHQLQLICEKLVEHKSYTVVDKTCADFMQFALSACGYRATVETVDEGYTVRIYSDTLIGLTSDVKITRVAPEDGFKYCFTVPSSFLVLRRNGKIFTTGNSGKSFFVKREILLTRIRYPKDHIYIIDPDGEYTFITEQLGGEVVDLTAGNGIYLNPMDLDIGGSDEENNPIVMKSGLVASLIETMMGGGITLNSKSKSIIDRCVRQVYQPYLAHLAALPPDINGNRPTIDRNACPTLQDVYDKLTQQNEPEAQEMAVSIESFVTGSFDTFARRTNVNTSNNFICFNIKGLSEQQVMMDLGLRVCLSELWNRMTANGPRGIWTRMFIDEFHNLLATPLSADFCKKLWKQARKWMGAPTGITQNTEDLLTSPAARAIINNTNLVILLKQAEMDQEVLAQILHLDKTDLRYVNNVKPGSGLIVTDSLVIPFYDEFPRNTKCFKLLDTSPNDKEDTEK